MRVVGRGERDRSTHWRQKASPMSFVALVTCRPLSWTSDPCSLPPSHFASPCVSASSSSQLTLHSPVSSPPMSPLHSSQVFMPCQKPASPFFLGSLCPSTQASSPHQLVSAEGSHPEPAAFCADSPAELPPPMERTGGIGDSRPPSFQ